MDGESGETEIFALLRKIVVDMTRLQCNRQGVEKHGGNVAQTNVHHIHWYGPRGAEYLDVWIRLAWDYVR